MKLKEFIQFIEEYNVTVVLHEDPSLSGRIKDVDWDQKKVVVALSNDNNRVLKLDNFLNQYQMQVEIDGLLYVRLGNNHTFKVGQEVRYMKKNKWYGTVGNVVDLSSGKLTVDWTGDYPARQTYDLSYFAQEYFFVRVFSAEELAMQKRAEEIRNAPTSFIVIGKDGKVLQEIKEIRRDTLNDYIMPIITKLPKDEYIIIEGKMLCRDVIHSMPQSEGERLREFLLSHIHTGK